MYIEAENIVGCRVCGAHSALLKRIELHWSGEGPEFGFTTIETDPTTRGVPICDKCESDWMALERRLGRAVFGDEFGVWYFEKAIKRHKKYGNSGPCEHFFSNGRQCTYDGVINVNGGWYCRHHQSNHTRSRKYKPSDVAKFIEYYTENVSFDIANDLNAEKLRFCCPACGEHPIKYEAGKWERTNKAVVEGILSDFHRLPKPEKNLVRARIMP